MVGPEGTSHQAESSTPMTEQLTPMITEYQVRVERLWVSWYAVDAGIKTMANTRIAPTVFSETTTVKAIV